LQGKFEEGTCLIQGDYGGVPREKKKKKKKGWERKNRAYRDWGVRDHHL